MRRLLLVFVSLWVGASLQASPIPYTGKISLNGINFEGQANFQFTIYTEDGKAVWRNGKDAQSTISVPVKQGRYSVLLGGQGMGPISPELFLNHKNLFLSVYVNLNDGKGLRHLPPDQPINSVPHALSADLAERAKVAEEAKIANQVVDGSITRKKLSRSILTDLNRTVTKSMLGRDVLADLNRTVSSEMLSRSLQQKIDAPVSASRLDPAFKAYLSPLLEPKATGSVSDFDRLEGKSVTLSAPTASGHNLRYQWKKNGNSIPGATSKDLIITDLNATTDSGNYKVVVSNDFGSFSQSLVLNVFSPTAVQMVVGDHHALYLDAMGFPYGVGRNEFGELGLVSTATSIPTRIINEQVAGIATSIQNSLILKKDGSLWGIGGLNAAGFGFPKTPVKITDGPVKNFAAGAGTVYVVRPDGSLWSAGSNSNGRLGDGTTVHRSSLVKVIDSGVKKVFSKGKYAAVIKEDGSLWTFGINNFGQLGNGTQVDSPTPVQIETSGVVDVSPYWDTTLYVKSDGSLWGMGRNHHNMLKKAGSMDYFSPVKIVESGVTKAALGYWFLIYLKDDGSVWGRGNNNHGQLGQLGGSSYFDPVQIVSSGAIDVAAGTDYSMILMEDGKILTFGRNEYGQLGTGEQILYQTPQKLPYLKVKDVATNTNGSYFVDLNGSLWSVGYENFGDLGNGSAGHSPVPVKVVDGNVSSVSFLAI